MHISILVPEGVLCTVGMSGWSAVFGFTQSAPCALCQFMKSPHMHTGLAATLPWLVHHYVPTIHLPSTSGNIPHCTCTHALLQARLHCHIWTCLSNHVSHCLEEFSPHTSPSGTIYPMVGVP